MNPLKDKNRLALKEWGVVVQALAEGSQTLLLRKGGILDPSGKFRLEQSEFFMFPTFLHQQRAGTVEWAGSKMDEVLRSRPPEGRTLIAVYARVHQVFHLKDLEVIRRLEKFHVFNQEEINRRFSGRDEEGLHLIVLRAYRLLMPIEITDYPEFAGCRSWVDLKEELPTGPCRPVLDDPFFGKVLKDIGRRTGLQVPGI